MSTPTNIERTSSGRLRPVCEFCGRKGRAVEPDGRGTVSVLDLAQGWSVAPYPADFVHADGTTGDQFACPSCNRHLERGEPRRPRSELDQDSAVTRQR